MHQAIQDNTGRVLLQCLAVGFLDLPENLRLAHDHRIKACGDPENMTHGFFAAIFVKSTGGLSLSQAAAAG